MKIIKKIIIIKNEERRVNGDGWHIVNGGAKVSQKQLKHKRTKLFGNIVFPRPKWDNSRKEKCKKKTSLIDLYMKISRKLNCVAHDGVKKSIRSGSILILKKKKKKKI